MKKILPWVKSHLVLVILAIIAVAAFPAMWFVSSGMNARIRADAEADLQRFSRDIGALNVNYQLEPIVPGGQTFSVQRPPNTATTEALGALLERTREQVSQVREEVLAFNKGDKQPLVEGLFPEPEPSVAVDRRDAMARAWPRAHVRLLQDANAGSPPDPEDVSRIVEEARLREVDQQLGANPGPDIDPEIEASIRAALVAARVGAYQSRAQNILFYAQPGVFAGVAPWSGGTVPDLAQTWEWQWQYWVHKDVIRALALANERAGSVVGGPVKRIESIAVEPMQYPEQQPQPSAAGVGEIPQDYSRSLSGRVGDPASNPLYDTRYVQVQMIADSQRLPAIIEAFGVTNLMTIVDLDAADVSDLADLQSRGFFFGPQHLVRVTMRVETLWLREWTAPLMPPDIRTRLGIPAPGGDAGEDAPQDDMF